MSNSDEIRWQQRHNNLGRALARLEEACDRESEDYSELELAGLAKTFEFTFELTWKTLKDLLFYEGYEANSPRTTIDTSFEAEYVDEGDHGILIDAMVNRNLLSHIYDEDEARAAVEQIQLRYFPVLQRVYNFLDSKR